MIHVSNDHQADGICWNHEFATQLVGDSKMINNRSHWLGDSGDYFKVETRKIYFLLKNGLWTM